MQASSACGTSFHPGRYVQVEEFSDTQFSGVSSLRGFSLLSEVRVGLGVRLWKSRELVDAESLAQRLRWRTALEPVALMRALDVVVGQEAVEVALDLFDLHVPGGAAGDAEALIEQRAVHALDEAVGPRRADARRAMVDTLEREKQLIRMRLGLAAELPAVVGEDRADRDPEGLVKGHHALVEQIARGHRHLRGVDLREGERAEDVNDDLDVDLADALEGPPEERVLIEQFARPRRFHVTAAEVDAVP